MLIVSLVLIFNKQIAKYALSSYQPTLTQKSIKQGEKKKADYDWSKVNSVSSSQIIKARLNAKNSNYVGYVAIPSMKINLPISLGTGGDNLALGAATLKADQKMGQGNYVLASHMVYIGKNLLLSPIYYHKKDGVRGQKIYLTDLKHVYEYKTIEYKVVGSNAVNITYDVPGKKLITLFTCNYSHQNGRVMLRGQLVKTTTWKNTSSSVKNYIKHTDNRWIK